MNSNGRYMVLFYLWLLFSSGNFEDANSLFDKGPLQGTSRDVIKPTVDLANKYVKDSHLLLQQEESIRELEIVKQTTNSPNELFDVGIDETSHNAITFPDTENLQKGNKCNISDDSIVAQITIRKCCNENEFYNTLLNECEITSNADKFSKEVKKYSLSFVSQIETFSKKVDECSDVRTAELNENSFHYVNSDGNIQDCYQGNVYNQSEYCLEMIGEDIEQTSLVLIYCPKSVNIIPKCCPFGYFYDAMTVDCTPYFNVDGEEKGGDSLLTPYLNENSQLGFSDLQCQDLPVEINLDQVYLNGSSLCSYKGGLCIHWDKFCIDNTLKDDTNALVQVAHVCPEYFINKCCPEGESLDETGCIKSSQQSSHLIDILSNFNYHVKSISNQGTVCSPITIKNNRSYISWAINPNGTAEINKTNSTFVTNKFCIEDYNGENGTTPVLKVCSEEVMEYAEVSSLDIYSDNVLGKCCPPDMVYFVQTKDSYPACMEKPEYVNDLVEVDEIQRINVSHLLFTSFPKCPNSNDQYHAYELGSESFTDYAELTARKSLKIVSVINNCKLKETEISPSMFCVDYKGSGSNYRPYAFVCVLALKNPHYEKTAVILSLVGLSCGALIASLISLFTMRVRRGMITIRKKTLSKSQHPERYENQHAHERKKNTEDLNGCRVKTLAGKILMSYVTSQLIGYLVLGVISLADFSEGDTKNCVILTGFLLFFMLAAFCWNTSICLEGLLLTMNVRIPDRRRYILHSIWAWGVPGVVTMITLIRNSKGSDLPCDAIKPRIGEERCFFSDSVATLLFFYLPISVTVLLNGALLMTVKILRKTKLKKLEKDPNIIKPHGTIKKVLSVKNIKNRIRREQTITAPSSHSGLRTHQNKNIWIESLKLVLWSGTTWLMEIIGTLVAMYDRPQGEWYSYLWYIPVGCNCLRGLGIYVIISLTSDSRSRIFRTVRSVSSGFGTTLSKFMTDTIRFSRPLYSKKDATKASIIANRKSQFMKSRNVDFRGCDDNDVDEEGRRISVSTIVTNISGSTSTLELTASKSIKFYHSISRSDPIGYGTSLPNVLESFEYPSHEFPQEPKENETNSVDNSSLESTFWPSAETTRRVGNVSVGISDAKISTKRLNNCENRDLNQCTCTISSANKTWFLNDLNNKFSIIAIDDENLEYECTRL